MRFSLHSDTRYAVFIATLFVIRKSLHTLLKYYMVKQYRPLRININASENLNIFQNIGRIAEYQMIMKIGFKTKTKCTLYSNAIGLLDSDRYIKDSLTYIVRKYCRTRPNSDAIPDQD